MGKQTFQLGDWVSWVKRMPSGLSVRVGTVVEIVPPSERSKELYWEKHTRRVESYVVRSNGKRNGTRWWPEEVTAAKSHKTSYGAFGTGKQSA